MYLPHQRFYGKQKKKEKKKKMNTQSAKMSQNAPFASFFSAPEPKAQVHYCDHALSVVRPSSVRPSVVNFTHFQLLL